MKDFVTHKELDAKLRRMLEAMDNAPMGERACAAGLRTLNPCSQFKCDGWKAVDGITRFHHNPARTCGSDPECICTCGRTFTEHQVGKNGGFERDGRLTWKEPRNVVNPAVDLAFDAIAASGCECSEEHLAQPGVPEPAEMRDGDHECLPGKAEAAIDALQRECDRLRKDVERFHKAWSDEGLRRDRETARANAAEQRAEQAERDLRQTSASITHIIGERLAAERLCAETVEATKRVLHEVSDILQAGNPRSGNTCASFAQAIIEERDELRTHLETTLRDLADVLKADPRVVPVAKISAFGLDPRVEWLSYNLHELGHFLTTGETLYAVKS
jgi:hypothetical protein